MITWEEDLSTQQQNSRWAQDAPRDADNDRDRDARDRQHEFFSGASFAAWERAEEEARGQFDEREHFAYQSGHFDHSARNGRFQGQNGHFDDPNGRYFDRDGRIDDRFEPPQGHVDARAQFESARAHFEPQLPHGLWDAPAPAPAPCEEALLAFSPPSPPFYSPLSVALVADIFDEQRGSPQLAGVGQRLFCEPEDDDFLDDEEIISMGGHFSAFTIAGPHLEPTSPTALDDLRKGSTPLFADTFGSPTLLSSALHRGSSLNSASSLRDLQHAPHRDSPLSPLHSLLRCSSLNSTHRESSIHSPQPPLHSPHSLHRDSPLLSSHSLHHESSHHSLHRDSPQSPQPSGRALDRLASFFDAPFEAPFEARAPAAHGGFARQMQPADLRAPGSPVCWSAASYEVRTTVTEHVERRRSYSEPEPLGPRRTSPEWSESDWSSEWEASAADPSPRSDGARPLRDMRLRSAFSPAFGTPAFSPVAFAPAAFAAATPSRLTAASFGTSLAFPPPPPPDEYGSYGYQGGGYNGYGSTPGGYGVPGLPEPAAMTLRVVAVKRLKEECEWLPLFTGMTWVADCQLPRAQAGSVAALEAAVASATHAGCAASRTKSKRRRQSRIKDEPPAHCHVTFFRQGQGLRLLAYGVNAAAAGAAMRKMLAANLRDVQGRPAYRGDKQRFDDDRTLAATGWAELEAELRLLLAESGGAIPCNQISRRFEDRFGSALCETLYGDFPSITDLLKADYLATAVRLEYCLEVNADGSHKNSDVMVFLVDKGHGGSHDGRVPLPQ
ncbi:hypothetical protein M885DRAFT_267796 [Pelagophyceae sp. CCMP2097]|nr:hypothetical protein M885DRAFT_267796 [Pelagophyceae sp. CCMP2097]